MKIWMTLSTAVAFVILSILFSPVVKAVAVTSVVTSTVTTTVTSTNKQVCCQLVNVTGACRRRRNFEFIDKPEILTFDEDIEDDVDVALKNVFHSSNQFLPTKRLGMEMTPLVVLPMKSNGFAPTRQAVQPSLPMFLFSRRKGAYQDESQKNRFLFSFFGPLLRRPTSTYTTFSTETKTIVTTTSASFFIVGCTPRPFPFKICPTKRGRL
ncbi:uncharacterized protein LOC124348492 [Daphnia pulicaria]|uniref:uncharacterized protein LOC124348492 n=1 Tax=Daphnia pulicaria TaxID=35523 RepID=UPI001EEC5BC7|nr:uncharacterized protein LOC124348492 [Daphnia pulicaria]XP_046654671.1 uncharacterized protein LOC124348492 [Daphnia pulicaria]